MSIDVSSKYVPSYTDLANELITTSVAGENEWEDFANDCLQPSRLCLLGEKVKKVRFVNRGYVFSKDTPNMLVVSIVHLVIFGFFCGIVYTPLAPVTGVHYGVKVCHIEGLFLNLGAGICAIINAAAEGLLVTLAISVVLPFFLFIAASTLGIFLKVMIWKYNAGVIDKYLQYFQQERTICDKASLSMVRYKQKHWEDLTIYEGYKEKIISFSEAIYPVSSVNQALITQLPDEILIYISKYLDQHSINNLSSVSRSFKKIFFNQHLGYKIRQKALTEFRRVFGDRNMEAIDITNLMAYPPLHIPYHSFKREHQNVMIQRCGSTTVSQTLTLAPHELGGKKVRWGWDPIAFIAILKESCFDDASTGLKQYVEVISSNQKLNIY
jgi:hypothetical protein